MTSKKILLTLSAAAALALVVGAPALAEEAPAADPAPATATTPAAVSADAGKAIWLEKKSKCVKCHGEDGKGATKMGKKLKLSDMTTAEWQKKVTDAQIKDSVLKGIDRKDGDRKVKMKPLKGATAADAESLLLYVRSLAPKK